MIKKMLALVFLILCGFVAYIARPVYLPFLAEFLIQSDPLKKADGIAVLGGDDIVGSRVSEAVSLLRDGWAEELIVSGGPIAWGVHSTDVMRKQAEALGIPPDKITAVPRSTPSGRMYLADSTLSEARLLLAECKKRKYKTLLVVTSNFHTRRAKRILRHVFRDTGIQVLVHPSPDNSFRVDKWWTRRTDAKVWFLEIQKLAFSYLELR
ncbi:YdcF family protein [Acidobacteriia bacterium AH_259_A11_L15]|nr:YdcF family protein [Acidobacteriia bacterium AH_259_A11_L15]